MKIIQKATIEPVQRSELQVGDEILWSNLRCVVDKIHSLHQDGVDFHYVHKSEMIKGERKQFINYFRIIDCVEIDVCFQCSHKIPPGSPIDGLCEECEKEFREHDDSEWYG